MTKRNLYACAISLIFIACKAEQDLKSIEMNIPNVELYYTYFSEIENAYWNEDYETVQTMMARGFHLPFEGTTYDHYIFNAIGPMQSGEIDEVERVLEDYDLMLEIDKGLITCDVISQTLRSEDGDEIDNPLVYDEMCWEMAMSFYGQNDKAVMQHRDRLERIVADIKIKISHP